MDKFTSIATSQPSSMGPAQPQGEEMAWWFKWLIKIVAVVFGVIGLALGFMTAISLSGSCIIAGVILCVSSALVLAFEVPICCSFIQFIEPLARFSESRPHWQKVVLYIIPPIVVICLCTGLAAIFGSLCIVGVAALYFMLTVGKKAPLDQMRSTATAESRNNLVGDTLPK